MRSDPADPEVAHVGPPERLVAFQSPAKWGASPDGALLAIPKFWKGAVLMDRSSGRLMPLSPQDDVRCADVSSDKRWIATASHNVDHGGGARVWDATTGRLAVDLPVGGLCGVFFSPDSKWLVTTAGGACRSWEAGTWREGAPLGSNSGTCAFAPDGHILALGDRMGVVRLVVPETGREIVRLTVSDNTRLEPRCFSPDGAQLFALGSETQTTIYLFDLRAIRQALQELKLDWDAPPLPPAHPLPNQPSRLIVDPGDFRYKAAADRLALHADELIRSKKDAEALAELHLAIKTDPKNATAHNSLAWQLVMGPKKFRDPQAAVRLARRAVDLVPDDASYLTTLGVCLYRTGNFKEGVAVLEKSRAVGQGEMDALNLFFLAMCHKRLGQTVAAKDSYDRALKWYQERRERLSTDLAEALTSVQAEAAEILSQP
jgi:Tfp pilus assembly protein PilF